MIDLAPTVYAFTGADYPRSYAGNTIPELTGVSLAAAFKGRTLNRSKPLYFEHEDNAALMDGKWKLVGSKVSVPGGPDEKNWELYDIEADRSETKNLSKSCLLYTSDAAD